MRPKSMRCPKVPARPLFFSTRRRVPRRSFRPALRFALEALEPRTLLSNLWYVNSADTGTPDGLTPSTGFLSIQAAINTAAAGDTILVETGNGYNESDTVGLSNLTIEADSGQSPVLDGTTPLAQSSPGFTVTAGATGVTIEGFTVQNFSGTSAIFVQNGAALRLSDDTIENNSASQGGGIYNRGTITLAGTLIEQNTATATQCCGGGGIFNAGTLTDNGSTIEDNSATNGYGGGIVNLNGTMTLTSTTVSDNDSAGVGGGISSSGGMLTLTNVIVMANSAPAGYGGGIYEDSGTTTILDSTIANNSAGVFGAGIFNENTLSITDTTIENNVGGGIVNWYDGTLTLMSSTISGNTAGGSAGIENYGYMTLGGASTIENNVASGDAGGIYNAGTLTDEGCTITNNSASVGGGIFNQGTITLAGTTIEQNTATNFAGGIYSSGTLTDDGSTIENNTAGGGGGIYNDGTLTDDGSAIQNNSASQGGGIYNRGTITLAGTLIEQNIATATQCCGGGGIYNAGTLTDNGSTIEDNSATNGYGGGIANLNGTLTLTSTTVSDNDSAGVGGGISSFGGMLTLTNVIVMANSAPTGYGGGIYDDIGGTMTIFDSTIANNSAGVAGAGIFSQNALSITDTAIENNVGGGIVNWYDGTLTLMSSTISGNTAGGSAGIENYGYMTLGGASTIEDNVASGDAGGIYNAGTLTDDGGAIENNSASSGGGIFNQGTFTLAGTLIEQNTATSAGCCGGGIWNDGTVTDNGSTIEDNSATGQNGEGGGIFDNTGGTITLTGTTVAGNTATAGGGISDFGGMLTLTNVIVMANSAPAGYGGGIYNDGGAVAATGCTISGNSAPAGAAIFTQGGSLTMSGGTILAPATLTDNEIEIEGGASVTFSGVTVDSASTSTAIDVNASSLTATGISIAGYLVGISVENNGSATVTDSTLTGDTTGILVGSGTSDTCTVTATNDSFASDTTGVRNNQTGGSLDATLDWWGSTSGPTNAGNTGGTGAKATGNVSFSPWLGDANILTPDYLVFLSAAGDQYAVTPNSGNTSLQVTLGGSPVGLIPGGDTLAFTGSGGTVTINGETGPGSTAVFNVNDTSVQFAAGDGLSGSTIGFTGTAITRNVDAQGTANTFNILGSGASGPSGSLVGDPGTNAFVFSGSSKLIGSIQGGGSSTLSYAAYSSKVTVNLGNGTNGTATGVSGSVGGITTLIGSSFNDTLNAGIVPNVALTGGLGTNTLSGTGAGDSVVESIASSYTLTNTKLTGTGAAVTDNLSGISVASLTGVIASSNTFTVSGWTGTGALSAPAGTGTVTASKSAGFTLSNNSLSSTDGMSLGLSGITTANLTDNGAGGNNFIVIGWTGGGTLKGTTETLTDVVSSSVVLAKTSLAVTGGATLTLYGFTTANLSDTAGGNTFTVGGWTGGGSLTDTAAAGDTVAASKSAGFTLTSDSVTSGAMSLSLSGVTTANLTDTAGGNNFIITGWTGSGTLKGASDTLIDSVSASVTLADTSLAVTALPTLTLTGFTTANLTDTVGGNTFTVSGWTHSGSLTDTAAAGDTVAASKSAGFTLTSASVTSGAMSLSLSGITTANLTDTGGGHTFTVNGWTGSGSLNNTAATHDTVTASASGGFTLTSAALISGSMSLGLSGITVANLTDSSAGGNTFVVNGWTGTGSLTGIGETATVSESGGFTLTNTKLTSGTTSLNLSGVTAANLTDTGAGGNTFTVSGWTGTGSLAGVSETLVATKSAGFTLTNALVTDGTMSLGLSGIATANLTDNGAGGNTFTITGWTGSGTLKGTAETLVDVVSSSVALAKTSLAVTGGATLTLNGFTTANLTDTAGGNTFTVGGWTGGGSLTDGASTKDTVTASKSAGYTLTDTSLSSTDGMALALSGITTANLAATSNRKTFTVSGWTGVGSLSDTANGTVTASKSAGFTLTNTSLTRVAQLHGCIC